MRVGWWKLAQYGRYYFCSPLTSGKTPKRLGEKGLVDPGLKTHNEDSHHVLDTQTERGKSQLPLQ